LTAIAVFLLFGIGIFVASGSASAAELIFAPGEDAYVDDKRPTENYGSAPSLELRGQNRNDVNSYLKFTVSGSGEVVLGAFLRVFVERGGDDGGSIHAVSNEFLNSSSPWTEESITWDNAPPIVGTALDSAGPMVAGTWIEFDVSQAVTGDGTYSFGLSSSTNSWTTFTSSEGAQNAPVLAIINNVNTAPVVTITSPVNGTSVESGTVLSFAGSANDAEDGDLGAGLSWVSNLDGAIGAGTSFSTGALSVGTHTITASVTDSGTLSGSAQVSVTVSSVAVLKTLDVQVTSGSDDAEEAPNGTIDLTSSDLELITEGSVIQTVGIRFNNIAIENGSIIENAYIQFTTDETTTVDTLVLIQGQASDNAATFTSSSGDISSRPRTATGVWWAPPPWQTVGESGLDQRTENLAVVIEEIVSRPGWTSGNSLALIVTGSGARIAESFNGVSSSAPILHIEYRDPGGNRRPVVDAGLDQTLALPNTLLALNATVTDDGLPLGLGLTTTWTHVGGTGTGAVSFADPNAVDTTVTIDPVLGTYILRLTASDGEFTVEDEVLISVYSGGEILSIRQVNVFDTGFSTSGNPLPVPAIDPAGVVYHEPTNTLFVADSEINEVAPAFDVVQANIFQTPLTGTNTLDKWDTTQNTGAEPVANREPTGITYCPGDGHFYVSNDDADHIYRYAYDGTSLTAVDAVSTRGVASDPEGITCDPATGLIYVIGGIEVSIIVYSYNSGFVLEDIIDLPTTAGNPNGYPNDAEGIAFDPGSNHLFIVAANEDRIYEYDVFGVFIKSFDIGTFSPNPRSAQGLTIGPSSQDPQQTSFYISDAMWDNDSDPNERDGRIYEAIITRATQ
jgi:hypothetical protein